MKPMSFSAAERSGHSRVTRREKFLGEMQRLVPWGRLLAALEPHYPKSGGRGRPPIGLEKMLRMYFVQQWYGLADEALEDALYDMPSLRDFVGIDLMSESVPDATTLLQFRHRLENESLTQLIFAEINAHLSEQGLLMRRGTLVDATLIAAPPSVKNAEKKRDPDMHQSMKGNQWHFGMKAHIGADAESGIVHRRVTTSGNVADITQTHALLHGSEQAVHLDAGYIGVEKRAEIIQAQTEGRIDPAVQGHCRHRVIVTAINYSTGKPEAFKTSHSERFVIDHKLPLVDVALATSAAPGYFPRHVFGSNQYVDGGLFANAPGLLAFMKPNRCSNRIPNRST